MAYRFIGMGSLTTDLASAIQRMEGACASPTSCVNNNPGNLRAGTGQIGTDSRGFAIFPDYATGEAALERQVDLNIGKGLTLQEFFAGKPGVYPGYAPAADANNPAGYASTVAGWIGIDPTVPLQDLQGGQTSAGTDQSGSVASLLDSGDGSDAGLSTVAMLGLGIAALAVLAVVS